MGRSAYGRRVTCESCRSIDVREWRRWGLLRAAGQQFSYSWTRYGEPAGSVDVRTEAGAVVLTFKASSDWKSQEQRVRIVRTQCHLGGSRPWFRCCCGRRVAKLYLRDARHSRADIALTSPMRANRRSHAIGRLAERKS